VDHVLCVGSAAASVTVAAGSLVGWNIHEINRRRPPNFSFFFTNNFIPQKTTQKATKAESTIDKTTSREPEFRVVDDDGRCLLKLIFKAKALTCSRKLIQLNFYCLGQSLLVTIQLRKFIN